MSQNREPFVKYSVTCVVCWLLVTNLSSELRAQQRATDSQIGEKQNNPSTVAASKPSVTLPRIIAEWEPALGTMIAWPLVVPDELIRELAKEGQLYVLVKPSQLKRARERIFSLEVKFDRVKFIRCSVTADCPRDFGPHQVFDRNGEFHMVDHKFGGYPMFLQAGGKAEFTEPTGPGDDLVCTEIAEALSVSSVNFPGFLTGGNFLVDGIETGFCTQAQLDENKPIANEATFRHLIASHLGIRRLVVLENTEEFGIQHIDCWLKVLGPERLLVKRAPKGHPQEGPLERNVKVLSSLRTPTGRPYRIIRIDCPEVPVEPYDDEEADFESETPIAAYTNSLILNKKVFVPLYGVAGDKQAIQTWKAAMPGYDVKGIVWDRWMHDNSLHCRTRAVFDRPMSGRRTRNSHD